MRISYETHNLPFRHPFTISRGTKTHQPTFIIELEHFGLKGYGEAPEIRYYHYPIDSMIEELERKMKHLENYKFNDPERFWHFLHHLFPHNPFLVCALDIAGWDLYGKMMKKSLTDLWGLKQTGLPLTDYTIGIDSIEKMIAKMKEKPWPIYKVKLGTDNDIEIIKALRAETDAVIRVDANSGWSYNEALVKVYALAELGVELIEQPMHAINEFMKIVHDQSPVPLFADESCVEESDVEKCVGHFHGINIKLTKCGGITPARRMIENARKLGLQIMIGSMNESTIGSAAIAHLLPLIDHVDMDGPLLLAEDLATGLTFDYGKVSISDKPGLGIELIPV